MRKTASFLTSLLLILFASTETLAQLTSQKIDSVVENALVKLKVAGASVAIVKDGKVIHQKSFVNYYYSILFLYFEQQATVGKLVLQTDRLANPLY